MHYVLRGVFILTVNILYVKMYQVRGEKVLDKKAYAVLEFIVNSSQDGDSIVLEKDEILSGVDNAVDEEELAYCIEDLSLNEMIAVKYSDENLYVVTPLPKGRVAAEKKVRISKLAEIERKSLQEELVIDYKKIAWVAGFFAFLGGMFAAAIAFIIARIS
ncbi:MAG: hypothetical protein WCS45_01885 [Clostridia bacterium]|jgi:hypothetical protein|nr:hypothetical protein [Clostridiales bacterium]